MAESPEPSAPEHRTPETGAPPRERRPLWRVLLLAGALIAILYVLLRPMYGDYNERAHVAEAFSMLSAIKNGLTEHYADTGAWPAKIPEELFATSGKRVESIAISKGGGKAADLELTATLREKDVDRRVAGKTVKLNTSDGGKTWSCGAGTVPARALPLTCRTGN